jgi:branched-chain amino acid transport system permease protein
MDIVGFYLRKFWMIVKNEVLVLPSRIIVFLFFLLLLLLPVFTQDPYLLRILILASIFAILAASWDLLSGFTGQMNFGHALFFGVGAYTAALLNLHAHLPPWGSIPLGGIGAVLAGLIIGIPCLRLRGTYLALTTLAFPIILMGIVFALPDITGGELGITGLDRLARSRVTNYYITVVLMLVLCTIMWKITDSNTGIIFHAIREDELAVRSSGINTTRYKLLAFCLSGPGGIDVIPGRYLGGIWGYRNNIRPDRSGVYSISFTRVFPLLAGVPYTHVCDRHIINSALHAGWPLPVAPRQARNRMPPVQN